MTETLMIGALTDKGIKTNEWVFLALTVSDQAHTTKFYYQNMGTNPNGEVAEFSESINGQVVMEAADTIYCPGRWFDTVNADIRDFVFIDRVLDAEEIARLRDKGR